MRVRIQTRAKLHPLLIPENESAGRATILTPASGVDVAFLLARNLLALAVAFVLSIMAMCTEMQLPHMLVSSHTLFSLLSYTASYF